MKTNKYNYNKGQHSFADTTNAQQSRFYKNIMMPATHQQHVLKKGSVLIGNTGNYYYAKGNGNSINQNNAHFNQQTQQLNAGIMGLENHNRSSRQRFAPYPFYKRSYAHAVMQQQTNQRCYNFQSQQQAMTSTNLANMAANQSSASLSPTDSAYGWVCIFFHFVSSNIDRISRINFNLHLFFCLKGRFWVPDLFFGGKSFSVC